ncbi:hypothetical protein [Prosthecobacter sp.]|uniref:hypothetical protein n=1 Tax=Prosthecobacter sp. TaxID=1965333 RepID=UPI0037836917
MRIQADVTHASPSLPEEIITRTAPRLNPRLLINHFPILLALGSVAPFILSLANSLL